MPKKRERALDAYIGARVRLRRLMLGMSQENLSGKLGVTFQQVQKYEKGLNRISASRIYELAQALSVPVGYFYDGLEDTDLSYNGAGHGGGHGGGNGDGYERRALSGKANSENEDATDNEDQDEGMRDDPPVAPLMEFMSSGPGVELNRAFLSIDDDKIRRRLLAMVSDIARVTGPGKN